MKPVEVPVEDVPVKLTTVGDSGGHLTPDIISLGSTPLSTLLAVTITTLHDCRPKGPATSTDIAMYIDLGSNIVNGVQVCLIGSAVIRMATVLALGISVWVEVGCATNLKFLYDGLVLGLRVGSGIDWTGCWLVLVRESNKNVFFNMKMLELK